MSWSPADDYDDHGRYQPGPTRTYPRFTRCAERCCTGTPLCHDTEETIPMTDQKPAPAPALPDGWRLADHPVYGRVIVTNPTPTRDGRVYYVLPSADPLGFDWLFCAPAELTYLDQEADQ